MVDVKREPVPKKTYTPIGCLVAVHAFPPKPLHSGLLLPDQVKSKEGLYEAQECLVIAVGPDVKQCKEGDVVLVGNPVQVVVHNGNKTLLIREDHIGGVVWKEPAPEPEQPVAKSACTTDPIVAKHAAAVARQQKG